MESRNNRRYKQRLTQIVEEDQRKSPIQQSNQIDESDYTNDSEIQQSIQDERDKLKSYTLRIDRLQKEIETIEHQREVANLNLSIYEGIDSEENSAIDNIETN